MCTQNVILYILYANRKKLQKYLFIGKIICLMRPTRKARVKSKLIRLAITWFDDVTGDNGVTFSQRFYVMLLYSLTRVFMASGGYVNFPE